MGKIFLNYRRGDEPGFALALYGELARIFQREQVFMDVEGGIPAGADFVEVLEAQVRECDVLLALIGLGLLRATDDAGRRRLDSPEDFVRVEIEAAMRLGKRVIPVLLNRAAMPQASDLPQSLAPLARRQAVNLALEGFGAGAQRLVEEIEAAPRAVASQGRQPRLADLSNTEVKELAHAVVAAVRDDAIKYQTEESRLMIAATSNATTPEQKGEAERRYRDGRMQRATDMRAQYYRQHAARATRAVAARRQFPTSTHIYSEHDLRQPGALRWRRYCRISRNEHARAPG